MKIRIKRTLAIFLAFLMVFGSLAENSLSAFAKENGSEVQAEIQGTEGALNTVSGSDISGSDVSGSDVWESDVSGSDVSGSDLPDTDVTDTFPSIGGGVIIKPFDLGTEVEYLLTVEFLMEGSNVLAAPYFDGWYYAGDSYSVPIPDISGYAAFLQPAGTPVSGYLTGRITSDETLTVLYKPVNGSYTVEHMTERLSGGYELHSSEVKSGYVNQMTIGQSKTITGFIAQPFSDVQIQSDVATDTVVRINYNRVEYSVKFQSNGGSYVTTEYVKHGGSISPASYSPTRTGYTFAGWYADAALTTPVTGAQTITADVTYYAKWTPAATTYKVLVWLENADDTGFTLYGNYTASGTTEASVTVSHANVVSNGITVAHGTYRSANTVSLAGDGSSIVNVYYSRKTYTITFYDGTPVRPGTTVGSITAKYNSAIETAWSALVGVGTSWAGRFWEDTQNTIGGNWYATLELMPGTDLNLYLVTTTGTTQYNVYYHVESITGGYTLHKQVTMRYGTGLRLTYDEDFHPIDGYTQGASDVTWEWTTGSNPYQFAYFINNAANLYYNLKTYTISYVNGDIPTSTANYKYTASISGAGTAPTNRPTGVYADWTFGGWYTDPDFQNQYNFTGATMPANNLILYAKWNKPTYTVTFQSNGGTSVPSQSVIYGDTAAEPLTDPTRAGYFFSGWYANAALSTRFDFGTEITQNTTVYAKWEQDLSTSYTVEYKTSYDGGVTFVDLFPSVTYTGTTGYWIHAYPEMHSVLTPNSYDTALKLDIDPNNNVITFYYSEVEYVWYRVEYVDTNGQPLAANKVVSTRSRSVIEYAQNIQGYSLVLISDTRKVVNLAEERSEAAISQNVVKFIYNVNFSDLSFDGVSVNYDGHDYSAALSGTIASDTIEYTYNSGIYTSSPSFKDAGTYNVDVKVTRGGNETTLSAVVEIKPAPVIIVTRSASKYYDGAPLTTDGTISGIVSGETCDFVVTGTQTHAGSSSNTYVLTWNGSAKSSNYTVMENLGTLTVRQNPNNAITVTADSDTKAYDGSALNDSGYTNTGNLIGNDYLVVTITGSQTNAGYSANVVTDVKVMNGTGSSAIDVTASYTMGTHKNGTLTVTKAPVTITTGSASKAYDGTALTATGSISGIVTGESCTFTVTGTQTFVGSSTNDYTLVWDNADRNNYELTENLGTLEITSNAANTIMVTADSASQEYNGNPLTANGYSTSGGSLLAGDNLVVTIIGSQTSAGTSVNRIANIKVVNSTGQDVTAGYTLGSTNGTLTVTRKAVNINTSTENKIYDGTALTGTGTLTGILANETFDFAVTGSQLDVGTSPNSYSLTWISANPDNYYIVANLGTLNVGVNTSNIIQVTADDATKIYDGDSLTKDSYTYSGALYPNDYLEVTITGSRTNAGNTPNVVTEVKIMRGTGAAAVDVTSNYLVGNHTNGTLTVSKAPVTVTTTSETKTYDGNPLIGTGTVTGIIPSETYVFTVTGSQTEAGSSTNTYTLVEGTALLSNYIITEMLGTLTVNRNASNVITVTANSLQRVYDGTVLSSTGYTFSGSLTGSDYLAVTISGSQQNVGSSANTVTDVKVMRGTGASAVDVTSNYIIGTPVNGTLSVTQRPITIITEGASKVYDGTALTAGGTISGFVPGETYTFTVTGSQVQAGSSQNTYSLIWNGTADPNNYSVSETLGTLTVNVNTSNAIVVTANSDNKTYDSTALTNLGYTYTGQLLAGDNLDVVITGSQTNAGNSNNVVSSVRILRGAVDVTSSYTIGNHVDGTLTVNKAPVTIITNSASQVYNGSALTAGGTITGIVVGEPYTFTVTGSQTYVGSSLNTYDLTWAAAVADNYQITENIGTLHVTADTSNVITVTAASDTKNYDGMALTNNTYTHIGNLLSGDYLDVTVTGSQTDAGSSKNEVTQVKIMRGTGATAVDVTGSYVIGAPIDGTLTVNKIAVTVTTGSASKVYDSIALTATGTLTGILPGESYNFTVTGSQVRAGSSTNTYSLTWGTAKPGNYEITELLGMLTVTVDTTNIFAVTAAGGNKVYDGIPLTNSNYTYTGTLQGSDYLMVTIQGSQTDAGSSSNRVIGVRIMRGAEDVTASYAFGSHTDATLTVSRRAVSIVTGSGNKVYDGTPLAPGGTITGIVSGETYTFTVTGSQIDVGSSVNNYTLTWNGTAKAGNYTVTDNLGTLTVVINTGNVISVTAASDSKQYDGIPLTNDSYILRGTVAGNDYLVVTISGSQLNVGTSVNQVIDVKVMRGTGSQAIDVTANYILGTNTNATLEVTYRDVYVYANDRDKIYAEKDPLLTARVEGLVGDERVDYKLERHEGIGAGKYTIVASGDEWQGNYRVHYVNGTFTIKPREVIVYVDSIEKLIGSDDPALTATVEGLLGGDTLSYTISREPGEEPGTYIITAIGMELQGSYVVKFVVGEFTIIDELTWAARSKKSPKTGEEGYMSVWTMGLIGSASLLTALFHTRRKRRRR